MSLAIDLQKMQSVYISADSDPEKLKHSISKLLYIRKEIAIAMLNCVDDIRNKELTEMYRCINYDICRVLGIVI